MGENVRQNRLSHSFGLNVSRRKKKEEKLNNDLKKPSFASVQN